MSDENLNSETELTKEKRSWFHSLSRRKKLQPENQCNGVFGEKNDISAEKSNNFFKRMRKKLNLTSLRRKSRDSEIDDEKNGTTDASEEFLTQKPTSQFNSGCVDLQLPAQTLGVEEENIVPYSQDFRRYLTEKWRSDNGINHISSVMFRASSEMLNQVWYWGEISRRDAQKQLTDKPTGSFLVRDSETEIGFTLSFRIINVTLHYRLEYRENYWRFEELQYESIVEMIEDILYRCTNDNFLCFVKVPNDIQPQFPVILKYPLSRYSKMPLLQDLCRRAIQRNSTTAEISNLLLPTKLQEYLAEKRGLVFTY